MSVSISKIRVDILILAGVILLSLISIRLIYIPGCAWETHDMIFNMERYAAAAEAFDQGQPAARWSRDINYGYGYPLLLFYPPLTVYLIGILNLLGLKLLTATKTMITVSMILSALFAYILGKFIWKNQPGGVLTAVCYVFLPYHILTLMTRGALAEFVAQAFLPGLLWSYLRLIINTSNPTGKNIFTNNRIIIASLFCATVLLTHNASWLLVMPVVLITTWIAGTFSRQILMKSLASTLLGMGLTCYYWLPAFVEKSLVKISSLQQAEHLSYLNHFSNLDKITSELWAYSGIGTVLSIVWILSCAGAFKIKHSRLKPGIVCLLALTPLIILCCTPIGKPLWDTIELLQFVQFPWRLTAIAGLTASATAPALLCLLPSKTMKWIVIVVITGCLYWTGTLQTVRPIFRFNDNSGLNTKHLRESGTTTVVADEYLPLTVTTHPEKTYGIRKETWRINSNHNRNDHPRAICIPHKDISDTISAYIVSDTSVNLTANCLYFPGWTATVDGKTTPVQPDPTHGLMNVTVPAGDHYVELTFRNTPVRTAGVWISFLTCILLLILYVINHPLQPPADDAGTRTSP